MIYDQLIDSYAEVKIYKVLGSDTTFKCNFISYIKAGIKNESFFV